MIPKEDIFSTIREAHLATGHGGEKRTRYEIFENRRIANITNAHIRTFISLCEICQKKKYFNRTKNHRTPMSIISSKFGERGQVDLIDLSANPSEGYKYILNYQDHLTKFVVLKPLESKNASVVAENVLDIFTTFGAPSILQCDNGLEFSQLEPLLKKHWPQSKFITSRPRHPQSQGSVERANGDVMNIMKCWLHDNGDNDWKKYLKFVQLQKNSAYNRTIKCSPYKAVFGTEPPSVFNLVTTNEEEEEIPDIESNIDDEIQSEDEDEMVVASSSSNIIETQMSNDDDDDDLVNNVSTNVSNVNIVREKVAQELENSSSKNVIDNDDEEDVIVRGTPVTVEIPKIDYPTKLSFPNIIGVIYKYHPDIKKYQIKTKHGMINRYFLRRDIRECPNLSIDISYDDDDDDDDDDNNVFLPIRKLAKLDCINFVGCKCSGKCQNNVCFCFRVKKLCGKFCKHKHSTTCTNKLMSKRETKRRSCTK